jgi:hypothetical protein
MSFTLESLYKSIVREIESIRTEILGKEISSNMQYHSWDSRGELTELPDTDIIGLMGWTYAENEGLPTIQIGITMSLVLDQNQFREVQALDVIRNRFVGLKGDYQTIALYDPDNLQEISVLQVSDFEVMPAGRSEVRSTRNIAIELLRTSGD